MRDFPLSTAAHPTKQAMVRETLRSAILDGKLPPGERVVIDEVARRMGISIIPVREAINQLAAEHLVELIPHVGPVVTGFDDDAVAELFALLESLESAAARFAIQRASAEDLAEIDKLAAAVERSQLARWEEANARFHARLAACARMPRISEHLARVSADWERFYRVSLRGGPAHDRVQAESEHRTMAAALRSRDQAALEAAIRAHNRRAAEHYLAQAAKPALPPAAGLHSL